MQTILLTGGTGFVGGHLLERLIEEKYKIILLTRSSTNICTLKDLIGQNAIHVCNKDKISFDEIFQTYNIDVVMHLATSYGRKGESASQIAESAISLPMSLLEHAIKYDTKAFVNTDSYFNQSIQLSDNIGIHAEAKRDFLKYAKRMIQDTPIKFLNLIMGHVYGPRDHEKKLVPAMINKLINQETPIELVKGENQRNFIYVKDVINVYMTMLEQIDTMERQYEDFYDRTGEIVTVREMIEMLKDIIQSASEFLFGTVPDREKEIMTITPDLHTTIHQRGRTPNYTVRQGLEETVAYYQSISRSDEK